MFWMEVPYDRRTMAVRVPDENLAGVLSDAKVNMFPRTN